MKYEKPLIEVLDFVAMERLAIVEERDAENRDSVDLNSDINAGYKPKPNT